MGQSLVAGTEVHKVAPLHRESRRKVRVLIPSRGHHVSCGCIHKVCFWKYVNLVSPIVGTPLGAAVEVRMRGSRSCPFLTASLPALQTLTGGSSEHALLLGKLHPPLAEPRSR